MTRGSCLCGKIRFEVTVQFLGMVNCHYSDCRKAYGSGFGTEAVCRMDDFGYVEGEELIKSYQHSERVMRDFCGECDASTW